MAGAGHTLPLPELTNLCAAAFRALAVGERAARDAAEILALAEAMAIPTHGVQRVLSYGERLRSGAIAPGARIEAERLAPALIRIDGHNALGPAVARRALDEAMRAARDTGVAAAFCRGSNHIGALAPYLLLAARQGFACILTTTASPMMAPPGGRNALVGNDPLGVGIPNPGGAPLLLDMALTAAARSRIRAAAAEGRAIPDDWALDAAGRPTTDAQRALAGLLLPAGGHKGAGLALALDALAGLWSGAAFLTGIVSLSEDPNARQNLGQCVIVIDMGRLLPEAEAGRRMAQFARLVADSAAAETGDPLRLPGARAIAALRRAETAGVILPVPLIEDLRALAGP